MTVTICKDDLYEMDVNYLIKIYSHLFNPTKKHNRVFTKEEVIHNIICSSHEQGVKLYDKGIIEIMKDGYGFLRSFHNSYLVSNSNSYVSSSLIKKFSLRSGDYIEGDIIPYRQQHKNVLKHIISINGIRVTENRAIYRLFNEFLCDFPQKHLVLERNGCIATRMIDLVAPIGMGQRGMIVAPPKSGKSTLLHEIAYSITERYTATHLFILMIGERPEEADDTKRTFGQKAHVISSTFDDTPGRQIQVAETTISYAKKLVEMGEHVMILLDSLTRLVRAYNQLLPSTGKVLSGGIDYASLQKGKRFFGSARNTVGGGQLTIISTTLVDTGSRMDEVIFEEFKGTGNMEIYLNRKASEQNIFPAINILKSGTRKVERLLTPDKINKITLIRKIVAQMNEVEGTALMVEKMKNTLSNEDFFRKMNC